MLATIHLVLLSGIAFFDNGELDPLWRERVFWILIAAMPAALAGAGFRNPPALLAAALISVPISLISMAGATLPLLFPALCYGIGYAASAEPNSGP